MFSKEQLINLLRSAAECQGVAQYHFRDIGSHKNVHLDRVLREAADMLVNSVVTDIDTEDDKFEINERCCRYLVDKDFTYLSRRFTQGDIIHVVGLRNSDGNAVISVNDDKPIAGANVADLKDMFNNHFITKMN